MGDRPPAALMFRSRWLHYQAPLCRAQQKLLPSLSDSRRLERLLYLVWYCQDRDSSARTSSSSPWTGHFLGSGQLAPAGATPPYSSLKPSVERHTSDTRRSRTAQKIVGFKVRHGQALESDKDSVAGLPAVCAPDRLCLEVRSQA
jgi:hypothetical protein